MTDQVEPEVAAYRETIEAADRQARAALLAYHEKREAFHESRRRELAAEIEAEEKAVGIFEMVEVVSSLDAAVRLRSTHATRSVRDDAVEELRKRDGALRGLLTRCTEEYQANPHPEVRRALGAWPTYQQIERATA